MPTPQNNTQLACNIMGECETHYPTRVTFNSSRHSFDVKTIRKATNKRSNLNYVFIVGIQQNDITTALPFTVTGATKTELILFDVICMKQLGLRNQQLDDILCLTATVD